ncbi:metal-sensitive transcriptional regulator [Hydrogenophaga sp. NFH-34]|uniref:metal-sensitive transcriptional regulator n=1 Tax=Hydrogenophaga sp. NFH-34 TaxID=2744446 RepID=UPI001F281E3D|nr:metal-sensing transcriptional repressor [Hydrogenophaga sp. NFH-34]
MKTPHGEAVDARRLAELMHRLRRAEGQVRGVRKLLEDGVDCTLIAQQLLAARHALDSAFVDLNLALAASDLTAAPDPGGERLGAVMARLQRQLGGTR